MEIEKKYLLKELPENLHTYPSASIEQGYIIVTEKEELRVRKKGRSLLLTFKRGSGTRRHEVEIDLSKDEYDQFKQVIIGMPIHKQRINYPYRGHTIEIDIYKGYLEGLIVAEVEFPSVQSMDAFSPPAWFAEDVSEIEEFKNKALALRGFPASLLRSWEDTARPSWHFKQSGVVPFRTTDRGYEVLLITTRKSGKWIFPKGIIEPDLSPEDSAEKEALEEAGVSGTIIHDIRESYSYDKWNGRCNVTLYPLRVAKQHEHWAEEADRKRKWISQGHIDDYIETGVLKEAVAHILVKLSNIKE